MKNTRKSNMIACLIALNNLTIGGAFVVVVISTLIFTDFFGAGQGQKSNSIEREEISQTSLVALESKKGVDQNLGLAPVNAQSLQSESLSLSLSSEAQESSLNFERFNNARQARKVTAQGRELEQQFNLLYEHSLPVIPLTSLDQLNQEQQKRYISQFYTEHLSRLVKTEVLLALAHSLQINHQLFRKLKSSPRDKFLRLNQTRASKPSNLVQTVQGRQDARSQMNTSREGQRSYYLKSEQSALNTGLSNQKEYLRWQLSNEIAKRIAAVYVARSSSRKNRIFTKIKSR